MVENQHIQRISILAYVVSAATGVDDSDSETSNAFTWCFHFILAILQHNQTQPKHTRLTLP